MATRTIPFAVYDTAGARYIGGTAPTATVQYGSGAASSAPVTQRGDGWSVDVNDTLDALIMWSGTGIAPDHLIALRIPADVLAEPSDIPSAATNATAVRSELATELGRIDVATSTRLSTAGYTAPDNASVTAILEDTSTTIPDAIAAVSVDPASVWAYSSRTLTAATPQGWSTITEATLDTDGLPLGPMDAADVLVSAYSGPTLVNTARSDGDGGFTIAVPASATYTFRAYRVGYVYPERTVTVP